MRHNRHVAETLKPPLSSMIDIIFLLLFFFILTAKESPLEAWAKAKLPQPGPRPPRVAILTFSVLPGRYLVNDRPVTTAELDAVLANTATKDPTGALIIKVSPDAEEGELLYLLDRCHKHDLKNLCLLTRKL